MANKATNSNPKDDLIEYKEKLSQLEKETLEQIENLLKDEEKRKTEFLVKEIQQKQ